MDREATNSLPPFPASLQSIALMMSVAYLQREFSTGKPTLVQVALKECAADMEDYHFAPAPH